MAFDPWSQTYGWRSRQYPGGVLGLSDRVLSNVQEANELCSISAGFFRLARSMMIPVAIENPHCSRLWSMPAWSQILRRSDIDIAVLDYCACGMLWRKRTRFVSANVVLSHLVFQCHGTEVCDFTGKPHICF
ncbi:unnamed protein product [Prorocentrum cordatum]|uniref:Uncharacterized protein n=1 Tax=Prorocentrum cordatum TaxID=2364126 RepID=A0ABN9YJM2_9DINO|nr:unnamed protein product [Polarella glacialis]